jgi:hypothetical protein
MLNNCIEHDIHSTCIQTAAKAVSVSGRSLGSCDLEALTSEQ